MKFIYEYRTSDNAKHSGVVTASDREAAFLLLKKRGIRPSRFAEAPGFFNKLFGKGKRWLAIGVLCALCFVLCAVVYTQGTRHEAQGTIGAFLDSPVRRQPYGDLVLIDKGIRTGWADVFTLEGERFLASFAIPGAVPAVTSATEQELREALRSSDNPDGRAVSPDGRAVSPDGRAVLDQSSIEARQIRAMVSGMKAELREYLADGGTYAKYMRRLVRRQTEEISYAKRVEGEVTQALKGGMPRREAEELLEKRNAQLRALGIRTVFLPDSEGGKIF